MEVILRIPYNHTKDYEKLSLNNSWFQVEVDEARDAAIDLNDFTLKYVVCGMSERGKNKKYNNTPMINVDGYELHLESK